METLNCKTGHFIFIVKYAKFLTNAIIVIVAEAPISALCSKSRSNAPVIWNPCTTPFGLERGIHFLCKG